MRVGAIQLSAMLAALLLSAGLVLRISATLTPVAPETRSDTAAVKAIQLRDGANGVTLFDGVGLAPGTSAQRCITVRATGTRTPDEVRMLATSTIDPLLAPWLQLELHEGPALGDGRRCDGFVPDDLLVGGRAAEFASVLGEGLPWEPLPNQEVPGGHGVGYRFTATLDPATPNEVQGTSMAFDLVWTTSFDAAGTSVLDRGLALAIRFTEDSMLPMLGILALAILYLGIQDRLDTATPRLSQAALFEDVVEFQDVLGAGEDVGSDDAVENAPDPPDS